MTSMTLINFWYIREMTKIACPHTSPTVVIPMLRVVKSIQTLPIQTHATPTLPVETAGLCLYRYGLYRFEDPYMLVPKIFFRRGRVRVATGGG